MRGDAPLVRVVAVDLEAMHRWNLRRHETFETDKANIAPPALALHEIS